MATRIDPERRMWVVESSGGPRSGKGTITGHLGESYPGAETDETGLDYRAVTRGLISEGLLDPEMDKEAVYSVMHELEPGLITDLAAGRYEIIATHGKASLETDDVGGLVGFVSPHDHVRTAIKAGFQKRVERQVEKGTKLLIVDGRNLKPVIDKVVGAKILLRLFVDCEVPVAVRREAMRSKVDLTDPTSETWYQKEFAKIMKRRTEDENRENDQARKDDNAMNYWYFTPGRVQTARRYAEHNGLTESQAMEVLTRTENMRKDGRFGIGAMAYDSGRQVYYDTTEIQVGAMLDYARLMVDEAYDAALPAHV